MQEGIDMTDFSGGIVLVSPCAIGYEIEHRPQAGGIFPVAWEKHKTSAIKAGKLRARAFGARLFVELPI